MTELGYFLTGFIGTAIVIALVAWLYLSRPYELPRLTGTYSFPDPPKVQDIPPPPPRRGSQ